jgi:DNA-directed RNA polymerase specialized sigma24 family protein
LGVTDESRRDRPTIPDELIARARGGDTAALRDLYSRVQPYVGYLVFLLAGRSARLSELCRDICAEVLLNLGRFRGDSKFTTWVGALVGRQVRQWRKRQRLEHTLWSGDVSTHGTAPRGPEDAVLGHEALAAAGEVILCLPRRMYDAFVLVNLLGVSSGEAAKTLGGTPRSVADAAYHARMRIRDHFVCVGLMEAASTRARGRALATPAPASEGETPSGPVEVQGVGDGRRT